MFKSICYEEKYITGGINKYWFNLEDKQFKYSNGRMLITNKLDDKKIKRVNFWAMKPILNLYKNGKFLKRLKGQAKTCNYSWEIKFETSDNKTLTIASNHNKEGYPVYKKPFIIKVLTKIMSLEPEGIKNRLRVGSK